MDSIDFKKDFDGKILENAARKVADDYLPPITAIETPDFDQLATIIQYEETANISSIEPQSRIFYELDCRELMLRELSIYLKTKSKSSSSNKPSDWRHVLPEGNGARLLKILCS